MKIVLIGDSIRKGYQEHVKKGLADLGEVWGPEENGEHCINILKYAHLWFLKESPDIVHINCGLHDIKTLYYGSNENLIPIDVYLRALKKIVDLNKMDSKRMIILATTTPVDDERCAVESEKWKCHNRYDSDVQKYNEVIRKVAKEKGTLLNDLYNLVKKGPQDLLVRKDGVHFSNDGYKWLGERISEFITMVAE